jgi:hypothetical protein
MSRRRLCEGGSRTTNGRGDGGSPRAKPPAPAAAEEPVRQVRQVRQVRPHTPPPITARQNQRFLTRGGVSPERPRTNVRELQSHEVAWGQRAPRFPLYRRSESAFHIGAPSGLAPGGHVMLSDAAGGATEPAGAGRARKSEARATLPRGRDFRSVADACQG